MTRSPLFAGPASGKEPGPASPPVGAGAGAPSNALAALAAVVSNEQVGRGRRGLALCGAAAGAGVSFVAANLSLALAQMGHSVLVLDANLRSPAMQKLIAPGTEVEDGLFQYLSGRTDSLASIVCKEVRPNLSVIYAGGGGEGVQDLFDTVRFEDVMHHCLRSAAVTIVDTPPANRCAETRRIAAVTGYAAIVARKDISLAEDISALTADLALNRVELVGTILNEG